ncbi:MAG: divergent polysaccharide deacetylase family protein, partial [Bdellovibrionales bacterium]
MKFISFFLKPHRLIAILLGVMLLAFTQFVVFKPVQVMPAKPAPTVSIVQDVHEVGIVESESGEEVSSVEDVYYGDLIDALGDMMGGADLASETFEGEKAQEQDEVVTVGGAVSPRIAIVIDDLGMNREQSWNAINLEFPVTLAFLPYAENIQEMADSGEGKGHDIILHVPMQPLDNTINAGENVLEVGTSEVLLGQALEKNMGVLSRYVGINNHMGSAFTQDEKGMNFVMSSLKDKGLYYLDSRTIAGSVAEEVATRHGVPFLERDVFLDHEETMEYTQDALK